MDGNRYQSRTYYTGKKIEIPMRESDSFIEPERQTKFDLNDYCIDNPHGTYFIEVHGHALNDVGVENGDVLVMERSRTGRDGNLIAFVLDTELAVRQLNKQADGMYLTTSNPKVKPIKLSPELNIQYQGTVTWLLKSMV